MCLRPNYTRTSSYIDCVTVGLARTPFRVLHYDSAPNCRLVIRPVDSRGAGKQVLKYGCSAPGNGCFCVCQFGQLSRGGKVVRVGLGSTRSNGWARSRCCRDDARICRRGSFNCEPPGNSRLMEKSTVSSRGPHLSSKSKRDLLQRIAGVY